MYSYLWGCGHHVEPAQVEAATRFPLAANAILPSHTSLPTSSATQLHHHWHLLTVSEPMKIKRKNKNIIMIPIIRNNDIDYDKYWKIFLLSFLHLLFLHACLFSLFPQCLFYFLIWLTCLFLTSLASEVRHIAIIDFYLPTLFNFLVTVKIHSYLQTTCILIYGLTNNFKES